MLCPKCRREIPDDSNICCYCGRVIHRLEPRPRKRPNGSGSVYKLTDKRRTRPWVMAKGGKILGRYATKTAAQEALEKLAGKPIGDAIDLTLQEIFTLWKAQHYPRLKEDACLAYDLAWSKLEPLAPRKMRTLRTEDVQKIVDADVAKGRSRSTVKKIQTLYSQLCQYAMRKDILDRNYADFLVLPRQEPVQRDTFTEDEILRLRADADAGDETSMIILILIYTGYRINELLQKRRDQVDLDLDVMYGGEKTAAGRGRVVVIHPTIRPYVEYFAARATGPLLLSGYTGNLVRNNFARRDWKNTLQRLGITREGRQLHPHCTRYTFATRAKTAGVDNDAIKRTMGHTDFALTSDMYIQDDIQRLKSEIQKLK